MEVDQEQLVATISEVLILCLAPSLFKTFPRHRWLGCDTATDQIALAEAVHHIGSSAFALALGTDQSVPFRPGAPEADLTVFDVESHAAPSGEAEGSGSRGQSSTGAQALPSEDPVGHPQAAGPSSFTGPVFLNFFAGGHGHRGFLEH